MNLTHLIKLVCCVRTTRPWRWQARCLGQGGVWTAMAKRASTMKIVNSYFHSTILTTNYSLASFTIGPSQKGRIISWNINIGHFLNGLPKESYFDLLSILWTNKNRQAFLQQQCQKSTPLLAPHGPFQQLEMDYGLGCKGTSMSGTNQK